MARDREFADVERGAAGQLSASSFNLNVCDSCNNVHFDLKDKKDNLFCTASIGPESFRAISAFFLHAAIEHEASTGKKLD